MIILAVETSCDETAVALLEASGKLSDPKFKIIKSLISSQIAIHAPFGGVVPNLAKREHTKNLPILLKKVLGNPKSEIRNSKQIQNQKFKKSSIRNTIYDIRDIDLIAVTVGPGLEPALWVGVEFAKDLAKKWKKPLIGVNHLEGHLYSFLLSQKTGGIRYTSYGIQSLFPAIGLIVSGGHTILVLMKNLKEYKKLGETLDDAVGESFDKVARILNLPYPGGPEIERLSKEGNSNAIKFPSPMIDKKNYNFSYSGLKTSVLYYLRDANQQIGDNNINRNNPWKSDSFKTSNKLKKDIAASFQKAAFLPLVKKAIRAVKEYKAKSIMIGGGVAANKELARMLKKGVKVEGLGVGVIVPPLKYCLDNATMIAVAGYINKLKSPSSQRSMGTTADRRNKKYKIEANGNLNL
ncbi:MAG: tRNA (adenosine(37)-N6)-threonylcarbamoyltransferase complex transferase subunit TsaD [Candidatus Paceibacterota bacterium]|jgi:N6-L-threonylcarbamoyladenine synthase